MSETYKGGLFGGIDDQLLLILLFIAIFADGIFGFSSQGGLGGIFGGGKDENLIFFIILLLLFTNYYGGFFGKH